MQKRGVTLWNENRLHVDATLHPDGTLRFEGHDLSPDNLSCGIEPGFWSRAGDSPSQGALV
jgi:hypothetical protein